MSVGLLCIPCLPLLILGERRLSGWSSSSLHIIGFFLLPPFRWLLDQLLLTLRPLGQLFLTELSVHQELARRKAIPQLDFNI